MKIIVKKLQAIKPRTRLILFKSLLYVMLGAALVLAGFGITTWQYWTVLIIALGIDYATTITVKDLFGIERVKPVVEEIVLSNEEQLNLILDKISSEGIRSLTKKEKKFLDSQNDF